MRPWSWYSPALRWPGFGLSLPISSLFRWPGLDFSYLSAGGWNLPNFRIGLLDFVVDDVLWAVITVLESLVLAAMLCCFFVFCGCTL
ncbi:hypothetical protein MLD38_023610 [Melastoma candidum]|uniref:Uncharacterized protein n=1 Tax=Melastoma candidum TaxID=119954 RepID=A0ACB9NUM9_9MYRT|nr:hypothetical protein MLD38_023610 [Melastoma candidum]